MKSITEIPRNSFWKVFIDEAGSNFRATAERRARVVAVVIPAEHVNNTPLPKLGGKPIHMMELRKEQHEQIFKKALALPHVAAFGITAYGNPIRGLDDGWKESVLLMIDWLIRLLEFPAGTTHPGIRIFIENRGPDAAGDSWRPALVALRKEMPHHETLLIDNLSVDIVSKSEPMLAWADVLSFVWRASPELIKQSPNTNNWFENVLFDSDAPWLLMPLLKAIEQRRSWSSADIALAFHPDRTWPPLLWNALVRAARRSYPQSLDAVQTLIEAAYAECDSGTLNVKRLGNLLTWLHDVARRTIRRLPEVVQLQYEIARAQYLNHDGEPHVDTAKAMLEHAREWAEDRPDLAAQAAFVGTMIFLNGLRIDLARQTMDEFGQAHLDRLPKRKVGIWHSILGQLDAFEGNFEPAMVHFDKACAIFRTMKDTEQAKRDVAQTGAYLAYAVMQYEQAAPEDVRAALMEFAGLPAQPEQLARWVHKLCVDTSPAARWSQFLFWRWLAYCPEDTAEELQLALRCQGDWTTGTHHPWPWIYFYRWLVLERNSLPSNACSAACLETIRKLARDTTPIFQLMRLVMEQVIGVAHKTPPSLIKLDIQAITAALPAIAPHLQGLRSFHREQLGDQRLFAMLQRLLPFYFH